MGYVGRPLLHTSLILQGLGSHPGHGLLRMMEKKEGKLTCISIFQAFPSIVSINVPLARPGQKSARPKSLLKAEKRIYAITSGRNCKVTAACGYSEELAAIMQSPTVVL